MAHPTTQADFRTKLQNWIPKLVLSPSLALILIFVYGFILFSVYLSFTDSRILPSFGWVGFENYSKLFRLSHWDIAVNNLAVFASLYIAFCTVIGLTLAILLDQKIRGEGFLRPIFLYPMALSFIVTGTAWKWFLDPGIGLEHSPYFLMIRRPPRSTPWLSRRSGNPAALSWRCSSPGYAASTMKC
jgi:glucose/mannose transport system permease protein